MPQGIHLLISKQQCLQRLLTPYKRLTHNYWNSVYCTIKKFAHSIPDTQHGILFMWSMEPIECFDLYKFSYSLPISPFNWGNPSNTNYNIYYMDVVTHCLQASETPGGRRYLPSMILVRVSPAPPYAKGDLPVISMNKITPRLHTSVWCVYV